MNVIHFYMYNKVVEKGLRPIIILFDVQFGDLN